MYLGNSVTRWRLSIWHRNHPLFLPSMISAIPYVKGVKLTVMEYHPPLPPEDVTRGPPPASPRFDMNCKIRTLNGLEMSC